VVDITTKLADWLSIDGLLRSLEELVSRLTICDDATAAEVTSLCHTSAPSDYWPVFQFVCVSVCFFVSLSVCLVNAMLLCGCLQS